MDLKPGEMICPRCNGSGFDEQFIKYRGCSKCNETGKLDWIEAIVGKKENTIINLRHGMALGKMPSHPRAEICTTGDTYTNYSDKENYVFDGYEWLNIKDANCYYI